MNFENVEYFYKVLGKDLFECKFTASTVDTRQYHFVFLHCKVANDMRKYLEWGADFSRIDHNGRNLSHYLKTLRFDSLKFLIEEAGVNPDHKDSDGRSFWFSLLNFPLPKIEKELEDMITYLLEKFPEKILESSKEGFTAIESGLVYGSFNLVKMVLDKMAPTILDALHQKFKYKKLINPWLRFYRDRGTDIECGKFICTNVANDVLAMIDNDPASEEQLIFELLFQFAIHGNLELFKWTMQALKVDFPKLEQFDEAKNLFGKLVEKLSSKEDLVELSKLVSLPAYVTEATLRAAFVDITGRDEDFETPVWKALYFYFLLDMKRTKPVEEKPRICPLTLLHLPKFYNIVPHVKLMDALLDLISFLGIRELTIRLAVSVCFTMHDMILIRDAIFANWRRHFITMTKGGLTEMILFKFFAEWRCEAKKKLPSSILKFELDGRSIEFVLDGGVFQMIQAGVKYRMLALTPTISGS